MGLLRVEQGAPWDEAGRGGAWRAQGTSGRRRCRLGVRQVVALTGLMPGFPSIQVSLGPQHSPTGQALLPEPRCTQEETEAQIRALAQGDTHGDQGPGFQPMLLSFRACALGSHVPPGSEPQACLSGQEGSRWGRVPAA